MAEEMKKEEATFQDLVVRNEPRVASKDSSIRIISPKPKTTPIAPAAPLAAASAHTSSHVSSQVSSHVGHSARDWAAAVDLISEAAEAVRLADERAQAAEKYSQELADYYSEQVKSAETKIAVLESRLKGSDARVRDAEEWLARFHDAIMAGFGNLAKKPG
jgi:cobalamin biosynthesis Mg chelatase CobN